MPKEPVPNPCHNCGKPADAGARCAACVAARKAWYAARKKAGICVQTGCHRKARPFGQLCEQCRRGVNARTRKAKRKARAGKPYAERPY